MLLSEYISNINWIVVIAMTIFSFILGFVWHMPVFFGKIWEEENKPDKTRLKAKAPFIFGSTAILHFIMLSLLSAVVSGYGITRGLATGLIVSVFWIIPAMGGTYFFAGRSVKLLAVDAGMYILLFSVSGIVMGYF